MGHTYSSMKPINRVYRTYMDSVYHDINTIDDPEFAKELLSTLRKAMDQIADHYLYENLVPQLDMPPIPNKEVMDDRSRLCMYYMKKIIFAISVRSFLREIIKIDPEHSEVLRYRKILSKLVTKTKTSTLDRNGRVKTRIIYSDKILSETDLEHMYALYFEAIYTKHPSIRKFDDKTN